MLVSLTAISQNQKKFSAEITTWYQDKVGAVSISFDDASYTQYEYAYPVLEKYKLKATFSLVGEWTHDKPTYSAEPDIFLIKKMGWQQIKELHQNGHEIAAHGYKHQKYGKRLPKIILTQQMRQIKNLIESKINAPVYTLHYPYSFTSDSIIAAAEESGFLFGRTEGKENVNQYKLNNKYLLVSQAILNDTTPNENEFAQWIKQANGNWLILMYHHLFPQGSKEMNIMKNHNVKNTFSLYPDTFEKQIKTVAASGYWVAPIAVVGKYIVEREHTKIEMRMFCNTIKIKTFTTVDTTIYNQALTVKVKLPWTKISVEGSENDGDYKVKNSELLIDILPGKTIKIKKRK